MVPSKLIEELSLDLQPTRRLTPLGKRFGQWLGLSVAWYLLFFAVHGFRADLAQMLSRPTYILELFVPFALSLLTAFFALQSRTPEPLGRARPNFVRIGIILWMAAVALHSWQVGVQEAFAFLREGKCFLITLVLNILPGFVLYRHLREGATTSPQMSGFFAASASALMATALLPLACSFDAGVHLFVGHVLPVWLVFALIWRSARRLLSW